MSFTWNLSSQTYACLKICLDVCSAVHIVFMKKKAKLEDKCLPELEAFLSAPNSILECPYCDGRPVFLLCVCVEPPSTFWLGCVRYSLLLVYTVWVSMVYFHTSSYKVYEMELFCTLTHRMGKVGLGSCWQCMSMQGKCAMRGICLPVRVDDCNREMAYM